MKIRNLTIAAFVAFVLVASANAEDEVYYYNNNNNRYHQTDSGYQIPPSYQGEYYPREEVPATSYYNNENTSQNLMSNDIRDNPDAYQNYFYY